MDIMTSRRPFLLKKEEEGGTCCIQHEILAPHMSGPKPQQAAQQMLVVVVFAECSCSIRPATAEAEDIINKLLPFKQVLTPFLFRT
jgi:hypothetical protein